MGSTHTRHRQCLAALHGVALEMAGLRLLWRPAFPVVTFIAFL